MDREILDDLFCFITILKEYYFIQIKKLEKNIADYEHNIFQYSLEKPNRNLQSIVFLEYAIEQNYKRINFTSTLRDDLKDGVHRLEEILNKYYYEKEFMAISYKERCIAEHQDILKTLSKNLSSYV